jgi:hypothetical protein
MAFERPSLELFVNGTKVSTNSVTVIPVPKSGEIEITVSNVGKGTADQIMVDFFTPKQWTNVVTSGRWHQEIPLIVEEKGKLRNNQDWVHWSYISLTAIPGGGCKLVMPRIHLERKGQEKSLHFLVGASAKKTNLQQCRVELEWE